MLSVKEISENLGLSQQRVRSLLRQKVLDGQQVGSQWIVTEESLERFKKDATNRLLQSVPDRKRTDKSRPKCVALSFFSGAMGLDIVLEHSGIKVLLACEVDKACRQTISINRPKIGLIGDIWSYAPQQIRDFAGLTTNDEIDVIVGGPPCQAFSTAGSRGGFKDERGNALLRYLDLIIQLRPRFAVIENVRGLLSAPMCHRPHIERTPEWVPSKEELPGGALMYILKALRKAGYGISFNLYNAANFGVPQSRERVVMLCSRDGNVLPHLLPTHSQNGAFELPKWRTLRDALRDLPPSPCDHDNFPEERLRFYRMLKPGQYWKHLPESLHREALGGSFNSGGGKTGFLRRLDWDKPSCTLVTSPTMPATDICHPVENRPISVQEYARIQQFPDNWKFSGSVSDQYRQIGNAVPVGLGVAVGNAVLAAIAGKVANPPDNFPFSRYKNTDEVSWERKTRESLKNVVIDKRKSHPSKRKDPTFVQLSLFDEVG
jgi:DNA (cytosine-5)-methyltransferase 1